MADIITIANALSVSGVANTYVWQDITEAVDVSAYDSLDLQVSALSSNNASGFDVDIMTSMTNQGDNSTWNSIGTVSFSTTFPDTKAIVAPSAPSTDPMFRYIRYRLLLNTSVTGVIVTITGLARRGVRL